MKGLVSTLATIWRLAAPYFRSEDRWAGRAAARRRDRDRTGDRRHQRADQPMEQPLLQRAAGPQLGRVRQRAAVLLRARRRLHRARGLSALSQPVAPDPLAALDDQPISASGSTAPTTIACSSSATPPTTPTSASPKTSSMFVERTLTSASGLLSAVVTLGSFVIILWSCRRGATAAVRQRVEDPGYLVWAALIYA